MISWFVAPQERTGLVPDQLPSFLDVTLLGQRGAHHQAQHELAGKDLRGRVRGQRAAGQGRSGLCLAGRPTYGVGDEHPPGPVDGVQQVLVQLVPAVLVIGRRKEAEADEGEYLRSDDLHEGVNVLTGR